MSASSHNKQANNLPAIFVEHLSVSFGDTQVLDDISFEVKQGEIAALIGPNGSGKTTLLKAVLDLVPAQAGEVLVFGKHLHHVRDRIGYVPQRFEFDRNFPITVEEYLNIARKKDCPKNQIRRKLKEVGLTPSIDSKLLGSLSGGQLQRVLIAQAFLNHPDILFLDEPSTGIDIVGEAEFYDIIQHLNEDHGTTMLLVSHDIGVVSGLVDRVVCVNKKLLCSGPPKKALTEKKITELYGKGHAVYEHVHHKRKPKRQKNT